MSNQPNSEQEEQEVSVDFRQTQGEVTVTQESRPDGSTETQISGSAYSQETTVEGGGFQAQSTQTVGGYSGTVTTDANGNVVAQGKGSIYASETIVSTSGGTELFETEEEIGGLQVQAGVGLNYGDLTGLLTGFGGVSAEGTHNVYRRKLEVANVAGVDVKVGSASASGWRNWDSDDWNDLSSGDWHRIQRNLDADGRLRLGAEANVVAVDLYAGSPDNGNFSKVTPGLGYGMTAELIFGQDSDGDGQKEYGYVAPLPINLGQLFGLPVNFSFSQQFEPAAILNRMQEFLGMSCDCSEQIVDLEQSLEMKLVDEAYERLQGLL
jgi:hypothetical protein